MLAAVILAAGESRRMGRPKALLSYPTVDEATPGKVTFLEHLLEVAAHPRVSPVRVVLGAHADRIQRRVALDSTSVVVNPDWPQGQLSSIRAAIRSLSTKTTDGIILFLVDHPLVTAKMIGHLVEKFYSSGAPIVVPTYKGKRGHPVIFASALYDELLAAPADIGARSVVWAHAKEVLEVPVEEEGVVLNLNDPDTLKRIVRSRP